VTHVASNDPAAAGRFAERVSRIVQRLARRDLEGPEERLRSGTAVRSWPNHPLRLYYRRTATTLEVLRLYHRPDRSSDR